MEVLAGIFFLAIAVTCISVIFFWFFTNNPRLVEAPGVTLNVMFLLSMTLFLITMYRRLVEAPGVTLNVMFLLFMTLFLITMFGGGDL